MLSRGLLVILLCLNAAAALWWGLHVPTRVAVLPAGESGVPTLTLLAEAELEAQSASAELAMAPTRLAESMACLSVGPFDTPSSLRRAVDVLGVAVGKLQYREAQVQSTRGWRVYLPVAASRADALAGARALAAQGIRDYYVVTAGPGENTVSLGLFREQKNAEARQAELKALGIEAVVEAANEDRPQWWLEIAVAPNYDWRTPLGAGAWQARPIPCF
ncbi:MAG: SPOR domain-containing protein [Lysobacteraceae bacterium]|jgi:hypothetical protein|nr:hypothetical protein [Xanthomonadaceae bacterium]MCZ8319195.1 hypothetical protein [Silanimonas sp.]